MKNTSAYADGSVRRFNDVLEDDPRMARTPYTNADDYNNGHYMQLPKQ